jgi:tetratricopeptide (TPR) repeat protein
VHNDLADIYYNQQKKEEALEEYRKEIRYSQERLTLNPQDAVTLNDLAYALNGIGEYDKAKENINQALSLRPNYRQAYLTLAKIQEGQGNLKAAQETLNKAKELSSQAEFIERDISRIKKEAGAMPDVIYLKNGRKIQGRIKEEDSQKVVIEMRLGDALGNLTFYRGAVERIARNSTLEK